MGCKRNYVSYQSFIYNFCRSLISQKPMVHTVSGTVWSEKLINNIPVYSQGASASYYHGKLRYISAELLEDLHITGSSDFLLTSIRNIKNEENRYLIRTNKNIVTITSNFFSKCAFANFIRNQVQKKLF